MSERYYSLAEVQEMVREGVEDERAKAREESERERRALIGRVEGPLDAYWNNVLRIKIADAYAKGRADAAAAVAAVPSWEESNSEVTFHAIDRDVAIAAAIDALKGGSHE